jgi:DNA-binding NarL/FixJ family response regulator
MRWSDLCFGHGSMQPLVAADSAPPSKPRRPHRERQRLDWPLAMPTDPVWRAAVEADAEAASSSSLRHAWEELVRGLLGPWSESIGLERVYVLARVNVGSSIEKLALSPIEAAITVRVLCGEPQKAVAAELGLALSTTSSRCTRALQKLAVGLGAVPLPLVVAAQTWAGVVQAPEGRSTYFVHQGCVCLVMSVPRPVTWGMEALTQAEREVAQLLIEGRSRDEIAGHRSTSASTVANQIRSIFATMGVTGRHALIRRAIELRCFGKEANK